VEGRGPTSKKGEGKGEGTGEEGKGKGLSLPKVNFLVTSLGLCTAFLCMSRHLQHLLVLSNCLNYNMHTISCSIDIGKAIFVLRIFLRQLRGLPKFFPNFFPNNF